MLRVAGPAPALAVDADVAAERRVAAAAARRARGRPRCARSRDCRMRPSAQRRVGVGERRIVDRDEAVEAVALERTRRCGSRPPACAGRPRRACGPRGSRPIAAVMRSRRRRPRSARRARARALRTSMRGDPLAGRGARAHAASTGAGAGGSRRGGLGRARERDTAAQRAPQPRYAARVRRAACSDSRDSASDLRGGIAVARSGGAPPTTAAAAAADAARRRAGAR